MLPLPLYCLEWNWFSRRSKVKGVSFDYSFTSQENLDLRSFSGFLTELSIQELLWYNIMALLFLSCIRTCFPFKSCYFKPLSLAHVHRLLHRWIIAATRNPQAMSSVMKRLLCPRRCFPATFLRRLGRPAPKITRYTTASWKALNKLLEVFLIEIYYWDMISDRYFVLKEELCLISNWIWQGV